MFSSTLASDAATCKKAQQHGNNFFSFTENLFMGFLEQTCHLFTKSINGVHSLNKNAREYHGGTDTKRID